MRSRSATREAALVCVGCYLRMPESRRRLGSDSIFMRRSFVGHVTRVGLTCSSRLPNVRRHWRRRVL
eukprot:scaffold4113_cov46-Phaeocystis_antarctica.AAC.4